MSFNSRPSNPRNMLSNQQQQQPQPFRMTATAVFPGTNPVTLGAQPKPAQQYHQYGHQSAPYHQGGFPTAPQAVVAGPPVCPYFASGNCWVVGPLCQHGVHAYPCETNEQHFQQQQPNINQFPPHHHQVNSFSNHALAVPPAPAAHHVTPTPTSAVAPVDALKPSTLLSGTWTNERKVRGVTPVEENIATTTMSPAESEESRSISSSDTHSIDLNDTYTRDPWELAQQRSSGSTPAFPKSGRSTPAVIPKPPTPVQEKSTPAPNTTASPEKKSPSPAADADPWATWTVEASTPANTTKQTSPVDNNSFGSAAPPVVQSLWTYDASAASSALNSHLVTPNVSVKNSPIMPVTMPVAYVPTRNPNAANGMPALQLPPPAVTPSVTLHHQQLEQQLAAASATNQRKDPKSYLAALGGTESAEAPPVYPGRSSPLEWLGASTTNSSPLQPSTVPTSANQLPLRLAPGALAVEDLERTLKQDTQLEKVEMEQQEEEGKFKVHRYRGPRHCRACRFHSKSLHAQVVLKRDLNKRYKLDMFCKVCDLTIEQCVDDKLWQGLWDSHCKTRAHYAASMGVDNNRQKQQPQQLSSISTQARREPSPKYSASDLAPVTPDRQMLFGSSLEQPPTTRASRKPALSTGLVDRAVMVNPKRPTADSTGDKPFNFGNRAVQPPIRRPSHDADEEEGEEVVFMPF